MEWVCYISAETRGKAKSAFHNYWNEAEYTDVRCLLIKRGVQIPKGVYDDDCDELKAYGLCYREEKEE